MNRLCGNPDKCFGLGRIFLFFLILSHTHQFLLNSPYTQALNHFTSFTPLQTNSILGMCFLGRSSSSGLIIETSISYHTTVTLIQHMDQLKCLEVAHSHLVQQMHFIKSFIDIRSPGLPFNHRNTGVFL